MSVGFRDPQYTGQNRCWPCTVLNVGFVLLAGIALHTIIGAIVVFSAITYGLIVIWYRGYFLPGTPWLGQQLPKSVQSRFGTHESVMNLPAAEELVATQVLTTDFNLTAEADRTIHERSSTYVDDSEALRAAVIDQLDCATDISINRRLGGGERWFVFDDEKRTIHQWTAHQIATLNIASITLLSDQIPDWHTRDDTEKQTMLALIRSGVSDCPDCGTTFVEPSEPRVVCCGDQSLVGERRCEVCDYVLVDRNDLPPAVLEDETTKLGANTVTEDDL